jgi:hypothetical protein
MPSRYQTIKTTKSDATGSLYYVTNVYPEIAPTDSDYYVITTIDDRLDLLAFDFYQDSNLWWVIASANALPGDSIYPPAGIQLRIPIDIQSILTTYNRVNNAG